jgi:hypothetical protein
LGESGIIWTPGSTAYSARWFIGPLSSGRRNNFFVLQKCQQAVKLCADAGGGAMG